MELASGAGLVSWSSQGRWKSLGVPPRPALPAEEVSGLPFSSQTQFPVPELLALVLSATPSCPPRTFPPIRISWEAVFGARGVPRPCAVRLAPAAGWGRSPGPVVHSLQLCVRGGAGARGAQEQFIPEESGAPRSPGVFLE